MEKEIFFFPSYDEAAAREDDDENLHKIISDKSKSPLFFNISVYKSRIRFPIECLMLDANSRAEKEGKTAFVHLVGLGLGSWQICEEQARWMVEVCHDVISDNPLPFVSVLNYSWFPINLKCGGSGNGEILKTKNGNNVKIYFNKRNVSERMTEEDNGKLLVACYPWDGNAFPGNEYWRGLLMVSGDPAAASCSMIAELQNPYINKALNSNNIFIAGGNGGFEEDDEHHHDNKHPHQEQLNNSQIEDSSSETN